MIDWIESYETKLTQKKLSVSEIDTFLLSCAINASEHNCSNKLGLIILFSDGTELTLKTSVSLKYGFATFDLIEHINFDEITPHQKSELDNYLQNYDKELKNYLNTAADIELKKILVKQETLKKIKESLKIIQGEARSKLNKLNVDFNNKVLTEDHEGLILLLEPSEYHKPLGIIGSTKTKRFNAKNITGALNGHMLHNQNIELKKHQTDHMSSTHAMAPDTHIFNAKYAGAILPRCPAYLQDHLTSYTPDQSSYCTASVIADQLFVEQLAFAHDHPTINKPYLEFNRLKANDYNHHSLDHIKARTGSIYINGGHDD
ncbi:hypothetical protein [Photobacterium leiognathi]|uniref:hypothetical protein n=1 Tax=Photobacterium leiognathi TaxID=553611 RepID=UPI002980B3F5|nr:hypothetical protein [Photobacterium leiognathi]